MTRQIFTGFPIFVEEGDNDSIITLPGYGAAADGVSNDATEFLSAVESGYEISGLGLQYGLSGTTQPSALKALRGARLVQLAPSTPNVKTLYIKDLDNWVIEYCEIDCGGLHTAGNLSGYAAIKIENCNNWIIRNCRIHNGGPHNGIWALNCDNGQIIGNTIEDFTGHLASEPTDDAIQGVYVQACTNMRVQVNLVRRLKNYITPLAGPGAGVQALYARWSRGIVFGGTDSGTSNDTLIVMGNIVSECDEAYDYTGTYGSTNVQHIGNVSVDNETYGHKFTGASRNFTIMGNRSVRDGKVGIIVNGRTNVAQPQGGYMNISGNSVEEPAYSGRWTDGTWGTGGTIGIFVAGGAYPPPGLKITNNDVYATNGKLINGIVGQFLGKVISTITKAADGQVTFAAPHGLIVGDDGYITGAQGMTQINDLTVEVASVVSDTIITIDEDTSLFSTYTADTAYWYGEPNSGITLTELLGNGNTVTGAGFSGGSDFSGFPSLHADLTGTSTAAITDATWTAINWSVETEDTANIHSTIVNNPNVECFKSGVYLLTLTAKFVADGDGTRGLRFTKNGGVLKGFTTLQAPHATEATWVSFTKQMRMVRGDHCNAQVWQSSGASMNIDMTEARLEVRYLGP